MESENITMALTSERLRSRDQEFAKSESMKSRENVRRSSVSPPRSEKSHHSGGTSGTISSAMLDAKNARKRAEADLQLLANRIALLKAEEQKALIKMNETKSRAKEILQIKKRNEDMLSDKLSYYISKEMEEKEIRAKAERTRQERASKIMKNKDIIHEARRIDAIETKQEARKHMQYVSLEKQAMEEEKRKKAAEEKRRREEVRRLREKEKAEKEQLVQLQYARKIADEARRTEEAEQMIQQLEREERALIEKLKSTQDMQREAYETLQKSLDV